MRVELHLMDLVAQARAHAPIRMDEAPRYLVATQLDHFITRKVGLEEQFCSIGSREIKVLLQGAISFIMWHQPLPTPEVKRSLLRTTRGIPILATISSRTDQPRLQALTDISFALHISTTILLRAAGLYFNGQKSFRRQRRMFP